MSCEHCPHCYPFTMDERSATIALIVREWGKDRWGDIPRNPVPWYVREAWGRLGRPGSEEEARGRA